MRIIILILLNVLLCQAQQQMSLIGKSASQGVTIGNHRADLAIDGNPATYALSSSPQAGVNMAWWNADLGGVYTISGVVLTNGYNFENGYNYNLQNFDIYIVSTIYSYILCQRYMGPPFNPGETKAFSCKSGPLSGRSIYIKKLMTSSGTELALAEVSITIGDVIPTKIPSTGDDMGTEISLRGSYTSQIGTWNNHYSDLAVDGDLRTFSVACMPCTGTSPGVNNVGWWRIDFVTEKVITGVQLFSSPNYPDSNYLQEIEVRVSNQESTNPSILCSEFNSRGTDITTNQKISLKCSTPIRGRFITIIRKTFALLRPDAIAMAEFRAFGTDNSNTGTQPPTNPTNSQNILVAGATQSKDLALFVANLAIDGNPNTYSVAIKNGFSPVPWLQVDLGSLYNVLGAILFTSTDFTNAQYLQSVRVVVSNSSYNDDPTFSRSANCNSRSSVQMLPMSSPITITCVLTLLGRFVSVQRINDQTFRPDILSIAELKIQGNKIPSGR